MTDDFLVFGAPDIGEEEIAEVVDTLRSGWIGTGPRTRRFETEFARRTAATHAVAVSSGTAALWLALTATGIGAGDEVITTPLTFCATANAIVRAGARPVFADVDPATGNLDPEAVRAALTERTAAVLCVHLGGRPCDMDTLGAIAESAGIALFEDAAHAVGGSWRGRPMGSLGRAGCFSFYVTKNLTTGEGGMLVTADDELARRARRLSMHGLDADAWERFSVTSFTHYEVVEPGLKLNMTDLQAALGIHQLARLDASLARRAEIWAAYDEALADAPLVLPPAAEPGSVHARHLYSVLAEDRDRMIEALIERGVGTGVHYRPVHLHPWYREELGHRPGDFPRAEHFGARTLSLPLSANLTEADALRVAEAVTAVARRPVPERG